MSSPNPSPPAAKIMERRSREPTLRKRLLVCFFLWDARVCGTVVAPVFTLVIINA